MGLCCRQPHSSERLRNGGSSIGASEYHTKAESSVPTSRSSESGPSTATARVQVTATVMLDGAELADLPLITIGHRTIVIVGAGQHPRVWPGRGSVGIRAVARHRRTGHTKHAKWD